MKIDQHFFASVRGERAALVRQTARTVVALAPAVAWLVACRQCRAMHETRAYMAAALWGLLLLASFVSWGASAASLLYKKKALGWGFHATVGMGLTLTVFGALACLHLVSVNAIVVWSALGPLVWGIARTLRSAPLLQTSPLRLPTFAWCARWVRCHLLRPRPLVFLFGLAVLYAMAALQYAESVTNTSFNPWDDEGSYRAFARQFLDTGTLYQPFSYRRIGAYGGQSLLHAMVLALTDRDRLHIVDNGLCALVMLGLVTGYRTRPRWAAYGGALAAGLLAMTLPHTPHNTGSELSGVVFFLALFRLFDDPHFESAPLRSNAILAGLLAAGACTLRQNYLSAAITFVALVYVALVLFPGMKRRVVWIRQGAATAGATLLFLAPWLILSLVTARTAFYPIIKGNMRADFGVVGRVSWDEGLRWALLNLFTFKPISTLALLFLAAFMLPFTRRNRASHAFMLCNVVAFALMMHFFQNFDDAASIARYYFAFTVAFGIAATLGALGAVSSAPLRGGAVGAVAIAMSAVGMQFANQKETLLNLEFGRISALRELLFQRGPAPAQGQDDLYQRLQESVPRNAPLLAMLDHTYYLDGRRNALRLYDHPGAMGPPPGPPCFQGPEAFARYMHSMGIRYVAYQLGPSSVEYTWDMWRRRMSAEQPPNTRGGFYKNQARFELDFFDVLTALTSSRRSLFNEGDIRVLDLESPK